MCIDEYESFRFWSVIERMDIYELTGTVLLLSLLVISVAVIAERCSTYARAIKQSRAYESRALTALYYNHPDEAITATSSFPKSPVAAVVRATLDVSSPETAKPSWPAFHRAVVAQTRAISRSLWALTAIGWCSPPLGLLVALESTYHYSQSQFGLFVGLAIALPAISMHKYLSSQAESLILETDRMSLSIVEQLSSQLGASRQTEPNELPLSVASTTQLSAGSRTFTVTHRV
jgi:biopolymer transport protein ExbB/TolQ